MSLKFEPNEEQMESCRKQFLEEGGKALAKWGGSAALFTSLMSIWPAYRNRFNWRGQIFCVMGAGIAGFWIRGEQAVLKCHHARDAQRLKDIYEGRTVG